VKIRKEPAVIK